jgi:methionyl-tRNA formyltransferase
MGAELIVQAITQLGDLSPQVQPDDGVTYATKIDKAEACVDWNRPAVEVDRQIRGLSPFPGAWCMVGDERVKLLASRISDGLDAAGTVMNGFTIACADGAVAVTRVQRAGKTAMDADQALLGLDLGAKLA